MYVYTQKLKFQIVLLRYWTRRPHCLQRARFQFGVQNSGEDPGEGHDHCQRTILWWRPLQSAHQCPDCGCGHCHGCKRGLWWLTAIRHVCACWLFFLDWFSGHDSHHGCTQSSGFGQSYRGGRESHVDGLCLPAAPTVHFCVWWGRHPGTASQNCQVLSRWHWINFGLAVRWFLLDCRLIDKNTLSLVITGLMHVHNKLVETPPLELGKK